jgi:hypothetical protein
VVDFGPMKPLAIAVCLLHVVAVVLTSGLAMCAGADGHASYEWRAEDCCCAGEPESPAAGSGPAVSGVPACGGCADGLAPLPGGFQVEMEAAIPPPAEAGTVELAAWDVAGEPVAFGAAVAVPVVSLPLRC